MKKEKIKKTKTGKLISYKLSEKERETSVKKFIELAHEIVSRKR